jgi:ubiquinone/menaquinone biosynthesis C-methylase UbiE
MKENRIDSPMIDPQELIADYFDDVYPHADFQDERSSIKDAVLAHFKNEEKIKILDLCTGTGRALGLFHGDARFDLKGIDKNEKLLKKARENYPSIQFVEDNILNFLNSTRAESFHVVLMSGVSIHLFNEQERDNIIKNVYQILVENGLFIFDIYPDAAPELEDLQKNAFLKPRIARERSEAFIIYHRILSSPPKPSKQYVHLIERELGREPVMHSGVTDYYNITKESIYKELKKCGFDCEELRTGAKITTFIRAKKRVVA